MKKTTYLTIWVFIGSAIVLNAGICYWQFKVNDEARQLYRQKQSQYDEAQEASKRLEILERQSQELKQKEIGIQRKIPVGETDPLSLIKKLIVMAGQRGLHNVSFDTSGSKGGQAQAGPQEPYPLAFSMKFEGAFANSMDFLKALMAMERLINIEKIEMKRDDNILPYQQVSLQLNAYSFPQQQ